MEKKKDLSIINCIATSLLAYFFTVPLHELFHALTYLAYGDKVAWYSARAVESMHLIDIHSLPVFHRIMLGGGSASILNAIIAVVLAIVLLKATLRPMSRLFLAQFMGAQMTQGIGYFLIGGLFGVGDWGSVYTYLADTPTLVTTLRIILSVIGSVGIVFEFFLLNHLSYYFIFESRLSNLISSF